HGTGGDADDRHGRSHTLASAPAGGVCAFLACLNIPAGGITTVPSAGRWQQEVPTTIALRVGSTSAGLQLTGQADADFLEGIVAAGDCDTVTGEGGVRLDESIFYHAGGQGDVPAEVAQGFGYDDTVGRLARKGKIILR